MERVIPLVMSVVLLGGCYKTAVSVDDDSDADHSDTNTNTSADADADTDTDTDADTDADTDTDGDTDTDVDTDTDTDTGLGTDDAGAGDCTAATVATDCSIYTGNPCMEATCTSSNECIYNYVNGGTCYDKSDLPGMLTVVTAPFDPNDTVCCCDDPTDCPDHTCFASVSCDGDFNNADTFHTCNIMQANPGDSCSGSDAGNPEDSH